MPFSPRISNPKLISTSLPASLQLHNISAYHPSTDTDISEPSQTSSNQLFRRSPRYPPRRRYFSSGESESDVQTQLRDEEQKRRIQSAKQGQGQQAPSHDDLWETSSDSGHASSDSCAATTQDSDREIEAPNEPGLVVQVRSSTLPKLTRNFSRLRRPVIAVASNSNSNSNIQQNVQRKNTSCPRDTTKALPDTPPPPNTPPKYPMPPKNPIEAQQRFERRHCTIQQRDSMVDFILPYRPGNPPSASVLPLPSSLIPQPLFSSSASLLSSSHQRPQYPQHKPHLSAPTIPYILPTCVPHPKSAPANPEVSSWYDPYSRSPSLTLGGGLAKTATKQSALGTISSSSSSSDRDSFQFLFPTVPSFSDESCHVYLSQLDALLCTLSSLTDRDDWDDDMQAAYVGILDRHRWVAPARNGHVKVNNIKAGMIHVTDTSTGKVQNAEIHSDP